LLFPKEQSNEYLTQNRKEQMSNQLHRIEYDGVAIVRVHISRIERHNSFTYLYRWNYATNSEEYVCHVIGGAHIYSPDIELEKIYVG